MSNAETLNAWRERQEAARDLVVMMAEALVDDGRAPSGLRTAVEVLRKVTSEEPKP